MGASARNGLMPILRKMFLINFLYLHLHLSQPPVIMLQDLFQKGV